MNYLVILDTVRHSIQNTNNLKFKDSIKDRLSLET